MQGGMRGEDLKKDERFANFSLNALPASFSKR
jgi:hypothetical protein